MVFMKRINKIIKQINENKLVHVVNQLLLTATIFFLCGVSMIVVIHHTSPEENIKSKRGPYFSSQDFVAPIPERDIWENLPTPTPTPRPPMPNPNPIIELVDNLEITYETMKFEYAGRHFITSYCPSECGYNGSNYPVGWTTSSGTICHYSDDWKEPTTCAIDRNFHRYNEIILVGDPNDPDNRKIYKTEDTGPGVRGLWVDCFVLTYAEVQSWNTRYESVYNVSYVTNTTLGGTFHNWWATDRMIEDIPDYVPYPYWGIHN